MKKFISIAVACAIALTGCHSGHDSHHDEEHEHHHHEHLMITAYCSDWELFAETDPMVEGDDCDITAHFTSLSNFKPMENGAVTASMKAAGKEASQTLDAPDKPGIYKFTLKAPAAGNGTLSFLLPDGETLSADIEVFSDDHEADEYAEEHEPKSSNGAAFPKEKSWKTDFATELCRVEPMGQVIRTMARIQPSQDDEVVVSALSDGIVSIGSIVEGREVRQGEMICRIRSGSMADNNIAVRYSQAEAEYNLSKSEYERKQSLSADKIVSESELQQAKARYETAKAAYFNLKDNFNQDGQNVKSPIAGYIRSLHVSNGQYVNAGEPVATVSRSRTLLATAEIQPRYHAALRGITGANFKAMGEDRIWTLEELGGKVAGYGKSVSEDSPLIPVSFSISNKADFLPGSFVETWIITSDNRNAVTVANGALLEEQGNYFVYKQLTPEFFEKTQVKVGASDGQRTEILEGLEGGERVVCKGAMIVKLAQASGALDPHAGHNH